MYTDLPHTSHRSTALHCSASDGASRLMPYETYINADLQKSIGKTKTPTTCKHKQHEVKIILLFCFGNNFVKPRSY